MIRRRFFSFVMVVLLPLLSWGQSDAIQSVTIGKQVWMSRDLDVSTFRNGDPTPEAKTDTEWIKAAGEGRPAWCYYNNDPAKGAKYGKLYNWYAVSDPRGMAPRGWHIPTDREWTDLTDYLGADDRGRGIKMKSKQGWDKDGNGTNSSGFSGLPGGSRDYDGPFANIGILGNWWSSTQVTTDDAWYQYLGYYSGRVYRSYFYKGSGFSVRCLRD